MGEKPDQVRDYRDLIVWQEAMDIAELVYSLTRMFPKDEAFGMTSQMRRSAASVPANIAEGYGRAQRKSFIQYLRIAQGSLKELETHAQLSARVGLMPGNDLATLMDRCQTLGRRLVMFMRSLEDGRNS